jgi:Leucine-rich repeat (LRR) protein
MNDLALQLIAENKNTKAAFLDLGNCDLTEIPMEIGELVWLKSVSLASVWYEWDGQNWQERKTRNRGSKNDHLTVIAALARLTGLRSLILTDTQVANLVPLAGLTNLQTLNLRGTQVANLEPLTGLTNLQTLNLRGTQVTNLEPLTGLTNLQTLNVERTQVEDLAPLAGLVNLQTLNASATRVTTLEPVADLIALHTLHIWTTQVARLAPLAGLTNLQTLNLQRTEVDNFAPLAGLTLLRTLDLRETKITDLSHLTDLAALKILDLRGTKVTDLTPLRHLLSLGCPVHWSSRFKKNSYGIYIEGCPLLNPPAEIAKQGAGAILNYFRERELDDVDHLYEAKLLILGEGGAGKTSLLRRLYQPDQSLPTERETTRGITIYRHDFPLKNGRRFRLNVWDFGGQEIYHATHQFFLTRRSLYLLLDDTRKNHKSVSDEGFKYWLELIDLFGGHSPVLIFQNEKGGRTKAIDLGGIKGQYDNVKELYGGNLEFCSAADKLREGIEFYASSLSHIGEQLPARWIKVRADIETRASESPYITQQEYFDIYRRHMPFDRPKALHLSRYLHDLGVFLHFQDDKLLCRTVILQNPWATEAVFRILDDEVVKAQFGRFTGADCERLWKDSVYADMHPELLALMQRFELCYLLTDIRPQTWLAPQLLPPAKPVALVDWGEPGDLVLRYRYDFMPKGIISRLTVRLHRFVLNSDKAWVTGVLFERDSTQGLVELLASGSEIELRVRGPERKALLSVIDADLDALNTSFQGLHDKVDRYIPCNCRSCCTATVPEFFAQKILLKRKEDNRWKVECPRSYEYVDVLDLLDGIRLNKLPEWTKDGKEYTADNSVPRVIRIFLASSAELREDRDAFDLYFRQQNDKFLKKGVYLEIVRWENFLNAISETRLQDEYNEAVRNCDIFVSLFFTKTGKFTEEEFDAAYCQFKETGKPLIYTFFKNANVKTGSLLKAKADLMSMLTFQEKLEKLGHFYTDYDDIEHLKRQFRDQLEKGY